MPIPIPGSIQDGLLTFEAEGNEGGRYHSRRLHVPDERSGITIGRGYDLKSKDPSQIFRDLTSVGIDSTQAQVLSRGVRLAGSAARNFIRENHLTDFELTPQQQLDLFKITYTHEKNEARRLCIKDDVTAEYRAACKWDELHPAIRVILVDLKFRGDYTPFTRIAIQTAVANNDLEGFYEAMSDWDYWQNRAQRTNPSGTVTSSSRVRVPRERFEMRRRYLEKQVMEQQH